LGFRPVCQDDLAPAGAGAKVAANLAALGLLRRLQHQDRSAGLDEQRVLARWSGWGSVPAVFDHAKQEFTAERAELRALLTETEWRAAARSTLNAHYTDAAIAATMWEMVAAAGFGGHGTARVLEPGCGAGTFLGLAPAAATELIGVELDPSTAAIAAALYPHADIRSESFADTRIQAGSIDLVIGNVPFGKIALHDKVHNAGGHSLHNHFIIKSLVLTRPGGVVAVLTSHYTMDAANPAARREIAAMAELVAAVRLPSSAHLRAAGTQVITDVLVLRRRDPESDAPDAAGWETAVPIGGGAERPVCINRYFAGHPERVIGAAGVRAGQFGPELDVKAAPGTDIAGELRARLEAAWLIDAAGDPAWTLFRAPTGPTPAGPVPRPAAPPEDQPDHLAVDGNGGFTAVSHGGLVVHPVPGSQVQELTALLGLRDTTVALLAAEAGTAEDTDRIEGLRRLLNRQYDSYLARWGPINRITYRRTGRLDEHTGADRLARIAPPQGRFRLDPHSPAVYALENFDATLGSAVKAPIMSGRVIAPRTPRLGADSPADAVAICLDTHGQIRLPEVARLLGRTEENTRTAITGLVFTDPTRPEEMVPAPEYLSGNVRDKLAAAETAADRGGGHQWELNIAALRAVIPADLTPAEIDARLGASWIDAGVVQQFLREILDDPSIRVEHPGGSTWAVRGNKHSVLSGSTFGTERAPAIEIVAHLLEQRPIRVSDEDENGNRHPNLTETVAAQQKAREITERFTDWIWSDPRRASILARRYNNMFNAIVLRCYDGAEMRLPGLSVTFTPRDHQLAAVARIVAEPSVLLAHDVGAGKTAEMVIGAQELRRLHLASKPAVVVPNHMLEQFGREWMQLYPQARILAASIDDLEKGKRRQLVARIATGDWDAVILSRSAFERIPLSLRAQRRYLDGQLADMRRQLQNATEGTGLTVKRLEAALARAEERLKKLTDTVKDPGISFEQTGVDYLFIDEAHGYKNLRTVSNIPGVGQDGSQRALDLDMKLHYLRGRHGGRVATFATATPIANSMSEAFTMQRFLRPDLLDAAGLTDFDSWAATFGEITTDLELAPDGSRFRMASRFARFRNVPELLKMWHVSADVKTGQDLNLPTPALRGGHPETVVVPASAQLKAFMRELSARADQVQSRAVPAEEDNMLKVATHGRMGALDLRLLGREPGQDTKLAAAASRIAKIHHANADRAYPDSDVPGALQIVFCDLGTPHPGGTRWTAYNEITRLLTERGVPAAQIRYVHEARNDKQKGELFAAARNGRISVLLGSTEKMGVGVNVQARAIALHHLDCPWRPADLAQREGRILRQGNLNPAVEVIRYVAEGSFDAYLWQTVERKARFIGQLMRGHLDVREIEDIGDTALSYSEVKALATGDPRILDKARVDAETIRLERLERSHARNQRVLAATISQADKQLPELRAERQLIEQAIGRVRDTSGDKFAMRVNRTQHNSRADAAAALRDALTAIPPAGTGGSGQPVAIAAIAGFEVTAAARNFPEPQLVLELVDVPRSSITVDLAELRVERPLGIIAKLENRAGELDRTLDKIKHAESSLGAEAARARAEHGQPFGQHQALAKARARGAELTDQLADQDNQRAPTRSTTDQGDRFNQPTPVPPGPRGQAGRDWGAEPPRSADDHARLARDSAAASFTARTPIEQMDRPSVERELRHIHRDSAYYRTAHAARDALTVARTAADNPSGNAAAVPAANRRDTQMSSGQDRTVRNQTHLAAHTSVGTGRPEASHALVLDQGGHPTTGNAARGPRTGGRIHPDSAAPAPWEPAPPGGQAEPGRVRAAAPTDSGYPPAMRYPPGPEPAVDDGAENGPGLRPGHGSAVDHPAPEHVIVHCPDGIRACAPRSLVNPAPAPPAAASAPEGLHRWTEICTAIDPRVASDPHWPALAAHLDRIDATGQDVAALLRQVTVSQALPAEHPARSLDYRLSGAAPDTTSPNRNRMTGPGQPGVPRRPAPPPAASPANRYHPGPRR